MWGQKIWGGGRGGWEVRMGLKSGGGDIHPSCLKASDIPETPYQITVNSIFFLGFTVNPPIPSPIIPFLGFYGVALA